MARYASVNDNDYEKILMEMNSLNTHQCTNVAWNLFLSYIKEKEISFNSQNFSKEELNDILKHFYVEIHFVAYTLLSSILSDIFIN